MSGSIPPEIGSLRKLTIFNLVNNQLSGSIPIEIGDLYQLKVLVLSDNQLIGSIPAEIGNLSQLASLPISSGMVPLSWLLAKFKVVNWLRLPSWGGILPLN